MTKNFRFEKDSMGQIKVPLEALWGAQTQRSIINFSIGEELIPIELIYSLTVIKKAAANNNPYHLIVSVPKIGKGIENISRLTSHVIMYVNSFCLVNII